MNDSVRLQDCQRRVISPQNSSRMRGRIMYTKRWRWSFFALICFWEISSTLNWGSPRCLDSISFRLGFCSGIIKHRFWHSKRSYAVNNNAIAGTISGLLHRASGELCVWLKNSLPTLGADWWNSYVVPRLTPPQQQRVNDKGITSLNSLDLAALLRILDQNHLKIQ